MKRSRSLTRHSKSANMLSIEPMPTVPSSHSPVNCAIYARSATEHEQDKSDIRSGSTSFGLEETMRLIRQ